MKIVVRKTEFLKALQSAASIAPQKGVRPGLKNLLLSADADMNLEVCATDLEIGLRYKLKAEAVESPSSICIPAGTFASVVGACPDEFISIKTEAAKCFVISGEDEFEILGALPTDFPDIQNQAVSGKSMAVIESKKLSEMIGQCAIAAATEQGRYAINGVYFNASGKVFDIAATDGRRLSVSTTGAKGDEGDAIIGAKACKEIQGICAGGDNAVVELRGRSLIVTVGNATISTLVIEGIFPKYQQVIPKQNTIKAKFNKAEMIGALRKAVMLTSEETNSVSLSFTREKCLIESQSADKGRAKIGVKIECDSDVEITLNPLYLTDALKACTSEIVTVNLKDSDTPPMIKDAGFTHVLMPVNKKD